MSLPDNKVYFSGNVCWDNGDGESRNDFLEKYYYRLVQKFMIQSSANRLESEGEMLESDHKIFIFSKLISDRIPLKLDDLTSEIKPIEINVGREIMSDVIGKIFFHSNLKLQVASKHISSFLYHFQPQAKLDGEITRTVRDVIPIKILSLINRMLSELHSE